MGRVESGSPQTGFVPLWEFIAVHAFIMKLNEARKCSLSHGENTAPLMFPGQIWHEQKPNLNHQVSNIKHCSCKEQFHCWATGTLFLACVKSVNFARSLFTVLFCFFLTVRAKECSCKHISCSWSLSWYSRHFSIQMILTNQGLGLCDNLPLLPAYGLHYPVSISCHGTSASPSFSPETLTLPLLD